LAPVGTHLYAQSRRRCVRSVSCYGVLIQGLWTAGNKIGMGVPGDRCHVRNLAGHRQFGTALVRTLAEAVCRGQGPDHLRIMHWDTDRRPRRGLRHSIFYEISDNLVERSVVISSGSRMR
jgi:hypothetical protein